MRLARCIDWDFVVLMCTYIGGFIAGNIINHLIR